MPLRGVNYTVCPFTPAQSVRCSDYSRNAGSFDRLLFELAMKKASSKKVDECAR